MDKSERHRQIVKILQEKWISSQEELLSELSVNKIVITQATLSRDLRELQVSRIMNAGKGTRYVLPEDSGGEYIYPKVSDHLDGIRSVEFSGQFAVIKTLPGFANSVAYVIDRLQIKDIMGTIAGDDTILLIIREGINVNLIAGVLAANFPKLSHLFQ